MQLYYHVSIPDPSTHLFHVRFTCDPVPAGEWRWQMPVWTPGSYLVREFARQVDDVVVTDDRGTAVPVVKVDKNTWSAVPRRDGALTIAYTVYAHEFSVRTSHLDSDHGLLNGTSVFMYAVDAKNEPGTLSLTLPEGWNAYTGLATDDAGAFRFDSYDHLVDCPLELGQPQVSEFRVDGVPHQLVVCGPGFLDQAALQDDLVRLIPAAAHVFGGGLPYDRYVFILHLTDRGGGGLEHRNSAVMTMPRFLPEPTRARARIMGLFSHEYFHAWNVKRLHPAVLGPFDYSREVYTHHLWLMEGGTTYYAELLPVRAGLWPVRDLLKALGQQIHADLGRPGRWHQSVAESSWDAWIKGYRPDAHSPNATVSYYARGALVSLLLDLALRRATADRVSLDTLLQELWRRYPEGFPESAPETVAEELGGPELGAFFRDAVYRAGDLPFDLLETVGLCYQEEAAGKTAPPFSGLSTEVQDGRLVITGVQAASPAERAGLAPGDEMIAWDGIRLEPSRFASQVAVFPANQTVVVHRFRRGVLGTAALTLGAPVNATGTVEPVAEPTAAQRRAFASWCGQPWPFPDASVSPG